MGIQLTQLSDEELDTFLDDLAQQVAPTTREIDSFARSRKMVNDEANLEYLYEALPLAS